MPRPKIDLDELIRKLGLEPGDASKLENLHAEQRKAVEKGK